MQLTPNFHSAEFMGTQNGSWGTLTAAQQQNIYRLANRLQVVRDILNKPITITSGYRSPSHNASVGGAPNSYHTKAMAVDIVVKGMTPRQVQVFLKNWSGGLGYGDTFTHLDLGPTRRWDY